MRWNSYRLGRILLSQGYVSEEELMDALALQNARIGDILLRSGRLRAHQLESALQAQKMEKRRLGDILVERGYVSEEDIQWALRRMRKKLGEICVDQGLLTEYELRSSLRLQRMGPEWMLPSWPGKKTIH